MTCCLIADQKFTPEAAWLGSVKGWNLVQILNTISTNCRMTT